MNRTLHQQQFEVVEQKECIQHHRLDYVLMGVFALVIPALCIGWKMRGGKWIERIAMQLVEAVTLVFIGYFRKQLMNLLK